MLFKLLGVVGYALLSAGQQGGGEVPMGVAKIAGTDASSGIEYALISLDGRLSGEGTGGGKPKLTAQCTKDAKGKLRFELLMTVRGLLDVRFVAPWKRTEHDLFPPVMEKVAITMEFLGYTKVKPVKRQWTEVDGLPGEWKYMTPGMGTSNMEEVMFYLQYLKALPTLRLTLPEGPGRKLPRTVEFETAKWQEAVKGEELCRRSGL